RLGGGQVEGGRTPPGGRRAPVGQRAQHRDQVAQRLARGGAGRADRVPTLVRQVADLPLVRPQPGDPLTGERGVDRGVDPLRPVRLGRAPRRDPVHVTEPLAARSAGEDVEGVTGVEPAAGGCRHGHRHPTVSRAGVSPVPRTLYSVAGHRSVRVHRRAQEALMTTALQDVSLGGGGVSIVIVVALIAVAALVMGWKFRQEVLATSPGTSNMQAIGAAVQEGAQAYLQRQFRTLGVFAVLAFFLLMILPADDWGVRIGRSIFFLLGAGFSATIGYLGMSLATAANMRVADAARTSGP